MMDAAVRAVFGCNALALCSDERCAPVGLGLYTAGIICSVKIQSILILRSKGT